MRAAGAFQRGSVRIFICEDNAMIALMLEDLIEDFGHEPCGIADSFDTGLDGCRAAGADLALVDLDLLDGPTGLKLVEALAEEGVPSIIVSGQVDLIRQAHRAASVVRKPVVDTELRAAIERVGAGRRGA